ncbi:MAG: hypothetical protein ABI789_06125, partial [Usitatibacter sp.]
GLEVPCSSFQMISQGAKALSSDVFLQSVAISCNGFLPEDNYFHLAPSDSRTLVFTPEKSDAPSFKAHFEPLNGIDPVTVRVARDTICMQDSQAVSKQGPPAGA